MRNHLYLIILFCSSLILVQCRKDEVTTEVTPSTIEENATNVSFLLRIRDQVGQPIVDASVQLSSNSDQYLTDENGVVLFTVATISLPGESIIIEHPSYMSLTKTISGTSNSNNVIDITLSDPITKLINTGETGKIASGSLTLPTSLEYADGSIYTGPVKVNYVYLNPDDRDMLNAAPGNLLAINDQSEYQQLATLGMYSIELFDEQGEALLIPEGSTATIAFPVSDANKGVVPEVVPLWYYDEGKDIWIEDGFATLEGDMMIAVVSHFTWWNCDLPFDFVPLCMQFVDQGGDPIAGIEVTFFVDKVQYGLATTDTDGNILTKTPIGTVITISYSINGEIVGAQDIGSFDEASRKPVVTLLYSVSTISGIAVDCDMNTLLSGYGVTDVNGVPKIFQIDDGSFSFSTVLQGNYDITIYDVVNGKSITQGVMISDIGEDILMGNVVVCDTQIETGITGVVMIDTDGDGEVDAPSAGEKIVFWGDAEVEVLTDADGKFEVLLPTGDYKLILDYASHTGMTKYGVDGTADGDEYDGDKGRVINCTIAAGEMDDGNDFFILSSSDPVVSGSVMIDNDGDGIGDVPLTEGRVLYVIPGDNGEANTPILPDGTFNFEFVIRNSVSDGFLTLDVSGYTSVTDFDESPDPDGDDAAEGPNNRIPIEISFNKIDTDNNFVVSAISNGSISGTVLEDIDGDDIGDMPAIGILVEVKDVVSEETLVIETDDNGNYELTDVLVPAEYQLSIVDSRFTSISDYDVSPDPDGDDSSEGANNLITVHVDVGEDDRDNNFTVRRNLTGSISGLVLDDMDGDGIGDVPAKDVLIALDATIPEFPLAVFTDENGYYEFTDLIGGLEYEIKIVDARFTSISDYDESPDPDGDDSSEGANSRIIAFVDEGEHDSDNNFIVVFDAQSTISGSVSEDTDSNGMGDTPIEGISIQLRNSLGAIINSTFTDVNGDYIFTNLPPGDYQVEEQSETVIDPNFVDVYDGDDTPEDPDDAVDGLKDDIIQVTLILLEQDTDNNFVERKN